MLPLFEDCGLKHRLGYNSANELNFTQHEKAFAVRPTEAVAASRSIVRPHVGALSAVCWLP